jgi:hypothetical protein
MQTIKITVGAACIASSLLLTGTAHAFDMGNMMNPSKWMGSNNHDRYDDYRGGPGYGYGGPGWGGPGWGGPGYYGGYPGYGAPYGYGGYPGYGAPGYGYGGYPGYGGSTIVVPGNGSDSSEVRQLKARIQQLENEVR